jgi:hypothetical protein
MQQLFNNPNGRGGNEVRISFAKLYRIFHDRLEYMGANPDFDAVRQNACVEIEKAMGTFPNIPPLTSLPAPEAGAPAVKELEWRDRHKQPLRPNDLVADSVCGRYVIRPSADGLRFRLWMPNVDYNDALVFEEVEAAKAAAQADYTARILSATLPAAKPAVGVVEALTEAAVALLACFDEVKQKAAAGVMSGLWPKSDAALRAESSAAIADLRDVIAALSQGATPSEAKTADAGVSEAMISHFKATTVWALKRWQAQFSAEEMAQVIFDSPAFVDLAAALSTAPAGDGVQGMVMVPKHPTMAMLNAAVDHTGAGSGMDWNGLSPQSLFRRAWFAMLTASNRESGK